MAETGDLLRAARTRSGLSQQQVARRTGLPPSVVSAYENGRREPSARTFRAILRSCGAALSVVDRWDTRRNGQVFAAVMEMTDHLPQRRRGQLEFPTLKDTART